jgi:hypothetical protein
MPAKRAEFKKPRFLVGIPKKPARASANNLINLEIYDLSPALYRSIR